MTQNQYSDNLKVVQYLRLLTKPALVQLMLTLLNEEQKDVIRNIIEEANNDREDN